MLCIRCIRNFVGTKDRFKVLLYLFLKELQEKPNGPYTYSEAQNREGLPSNSIRDWTKKLRMSDWNPDDSGFTFSR